MTDTQTLADIDPIYRELQKRIDKLPVPFPETETGVELRLLTALFSYEEAEIALGLSAIPEPAETIARRLRNPDPDAVERALLGLTAKGAINGGAMRVGKRRVRTFGLAPLVVGMFEFQVDKLTPEYVQNFHEYMDQGFRSAVVGVKTAQMRTVPVRAEVTQNRKVAPHDDIRAYVQNHPGPFSVINCVCRQSAEVMGEACTTSSTHETCLMIGHVAPHGRKLNREEVIEILDRTEKEGHVLQPQNTQNPMFICCCCRDCCEILINARKLPRPADAIPSSHTASVLTAACTGCRVCVKRCPMDAITVTDKMACVDEGRCIGCGLCVTTCKYEALELIPRKKAAVPAKTSLGMFLRMYRDRRGILGILWIGLRKLFGLRI